ncbi:MAG TPA: FAD-binding protein, partial [Candidatus Angelobacter sp.]|nr:FAD-binding protein [Candidatus Angelobacter sp.]
MSTVAAAESVQRELAAIVGERNIQLGNEQFAINGIIPGSVVTPASPEEIAAVLALANGNGLVVAPAGGFTKQDIGGVPERVDILLRTTRLRGIQHYDPGDLTISIHAGTP